MATPTKNDRRARAAALQQAQASREKRIRAAIAILTAIPLIVIVLVVVKLMNNDKDPATKTAPASSAVIQAVTSVPGDVFDSVGKGNGAGPQVVDGGQLITEGGKPRV